MSWISNIFKSDKDKLYRAIENGKIAKVKKIITNNSNINLDKGLYTAAYYNKTDIAKFLISCGASIDTPDILAGSVHGKFCEEIGASKKNPLIEDMFSFLIKQNLSKDELNNAFLSACNYCVVDALEEILYNGADINQIDGEGNTGLHLAVKQTFKERILPTCKLLNGINTNIKNNIGDTALICYLKETSIDSNLIIFLLSIGENINCSDNNGISPLMWAIKNNGLFFSDPSLDSFKDLLRSSRKEGEVIQLFIDNGANINHKCNNNITPLCYAILDDIKHPQVQNTTGGGRSVSSITTTYTLTNILISNGAYLTEEGYQLVKYIDSSFERLIKR